MITAMITAVIGGWLLACSATVPFTQTETGDSASPKTAPAESTHPGTSDSAALETVPSAEDDGCPTLYRQDLLADLHLDIDESEWAGIQSDYSAGIQQYRPASFTWMTPLGEALHVEEAAVRLRGNPGFSWIGDKMQFLIAFDHWDDDARFLGLRAVALDASWYHPSLLRDRLAYAYLRRLGVPAPCANHATLTVNGAYYGLYTNVERMDREFLERVYGDDNATGGLWEAGYDLDANADNANPYLIEEFWSQTGVEWQEAHTDLPANVLEWAAEAVIPQDDGYWCCSHNFFLYEHPTNGVTFLPWDLDYSFDTAPWFASPAEFYRDSNSQPHLDAVAADPEWGPRWLEALRTAADSYDVETMQGQVDTWSAQIADAFADDPHTTVSAGSHTDGVDRLRAFVAQRRGFLDGWIACAQGDDSDADEDGWGACSDCDPNDATIHPGAAETCNRRDDDCDLWTDEDAGCDVCDEIAFDDGRFLLCAEPMTWAEADATCAAHGGALGQPSTTGEWYVVVYDTYWQDEAWAGVHEWWIGPGDGATCPALRPASWASTTLDCDAERPAICRL